MHIWNPHNCADALSLPHKPGRRVPLTDLLHQLSIVKGRLNFMRISDKTEAYLILDQISRLLATIAKVQNVSIDHRHSHPLCPSNS